MNDAVLVFGTTYNQVPLLRKIQDMGLDAWATATGDSSACEGVADRILEVDTSDAEALLRIVDTYPVKGLVTCGTATAILTIAYINEKVGLSRKVVPYDVAVNATIKHNFRRILSPGGLVPRGETVTDPNELCLKSDALTFPIVIKPVDAGGGKGVEVVEQRSEARLRDAFHRSVSYSAMNRLVVEEYVPGIALGVESITIGGATHVLAVAEKTLAGFPHCVTTGVFFPSSRLEHQLEAITKVNNEAIRRLGIRWGPTHVDMVLGEDGTPYIIDVGPRLAGGPIASALVESATGYDLYRAAIDLCLGRDVQRPCLDRPSESVYGSHFIVTKASGTISSLQHDETLARELGLRDFRLLKRVGDRVHGATTDGDRLAVFHLAAASRSEMLAKIQAMESRVRVEVS